MSTVTTNKKRKKGPASPAPVVDAPAPEAPQVEAPQAEAEAPTMFDEAVKALTMSCHEVEYTISMLPTSRQASAATKDEMVAVVGGKRGGYSVSKKLFASDHPLIKELNGVRHKIEAWRDAFTIVKSADVEDKNGKLAVSPGVRLIRNEDIAEFDAGYKRLADELYAAAAMVRDHMHVPYVVGGKTYPSILDADREKLGSDFNPADYPPDPSTCVRAGMPQYRDYSISVKLPKEIYKRQEERLKDAMTGTVDAAVSALTDTLLETFETIAGQLSTRTRVNPVAGSKWAKYDGSEVVNLTTRPDGSLSFMLRWREMDKGGKERTVTEQFDAVPKDEYEKVARPVATNEKKKVTQSTIENLMTQLENFGRVKSMLGEPGSRIDDALRRVRDMLASAGRQSGDIAEEVRNAQSFRTSLKKALEETGALIGEVAQTVTRERRKVSRAGRFSAKS